MSTQVDRAFRRLERRSERIIAGLRLLALLVMGLVVSADVVAAAPGLERDLRLSAPSSHVLRGRSQPIHLYRLAITPAIASYGAAK